MEHANNRNGAIDLLRLFFTLAVVAAHYISRFDIPAESAPICGTGTSEWNSFLRSRAV